MKRTLCIVLFAAATAVAFAPTRARACPNVTYLQLDEETKKVKAADDALANGDFALAAARAKRVRFLGVDPPDFVGRPERDVVQEKHRLLRKRAMHIVALATVRNQSTVEEREVAVRVLIGQLKIDPNPTFEADAAEALARMPDKEPLALMMLRALAARDLIGSAYAYAALARLEAARGNETEAASADERCKRMAKRPAICAR